MSEPVKLLILGTGEVGASIGLALRRAGDNFQRIGFDPQPERGQRAQQAGAVDRLLTSPRGAAREADLVVLTLPPEQAVELAAVIAGEIRPDTVVLYTFRLQAEALGKISQALGPSVPCLGAIPFLGPQRALAPGPGEASADAFDRGMLGIVSPPGTPQGAVEICLDLAAILRATPFFLDPAELDSVTATSEEFPTLLAAGWIGSLDANPGWRDQRRLVGVPFARLSGLLEGAAASELAAEWVANRRTLTARLDALAEELADVRQLLEAADEPALAQRLESAANRYQEWRTFRAESRPDHGVEFADVPRVNLFERLVGGRRPRNTPR
jgi:prephenate dehydrogenase